MAHKKKKKESMESTMVAPYRPPTRVRLTKQQAGNFSVGEKVKITITGSVVGISANKNYMDGKEKITGYEVELDPSSVVDVSGNPAVKALKRMKE